MRWWCLCVCAAAWVGCAGAEKVEVAAPDRAQEVARAEAALAKWKETLTGGSKVLFAGVGEHSDGSGRVALRVEVAGPQAASSVRVDADVPVEVVAVGEDPPEGACVHEGAVYPPGPRAVPVGCNTCGCEDGRLSLCTLMGCKILVLEQIFFGAGADELAGEEARRAEALGDDLGEAGIPVMVIGHAGASEADAEGLGLRRARRVEALLRGRGAQAFGAVSRGAEEPAVAQGEEGNRRVSFRAVVIEFAHGGWAVEPAAVEALEAFLPALQGPGAPVVVVGHASTREGDAATQQWISEARARAVRAWFLERGVDAARLSEVRGEGARAPLGAPWMSRRVTFSAR